MKYDIVQEARDYVLECTGSAPDFAVIMGSGISALDEILRDSTRIHYVAIPNFPVPRVAGHRGQVVFGTVFGLKVIVFEGRVHQYEGYTNDEVSFCARVIGMTGARKLLLTNAAGAINPMFAPGQLMLISDHINLLGTNPLTGPAEPRWGARFVDQTAVYDPGLKQELSDAARYCGYPLIEGVYAAMAGPTYETPAEVRFLKTIGADAVGMSTVPEAIVARQMGLQIAGISMLTNVAGGSGKPLDHSEVLAMTSQMHADLGMLLLRFFEIHAERSH